MIRVLLSLCIFSLFACSHAQELELGASRMDQYLHLLENKRVGLVVNQTSVINTTHLVDTLLSRGVNVVKVMAPEHGFRGEAPDGAKIDDAKDEKTGLPIISIYGKSKKPSPEMLEDLDVLIFDIQDVGIRFYTFISTMHYVMEAAAENGKKVIVLDRPNPNGMYVDGPVKDDDINSFVAMHPIPVVHGLTVGELALMINAEGWLKDGVKSDLTVISMAGWDHTKTYSLPISPSPNLPTDNAITLYPSLGFFEGTVVSVGRGTDFPFEVIGHPDYSKGTFSFTPKPNQGSKYPPLEDELCVGKFFGNETAKHELNLSYLLEYHNDLKDDTTFFRPYINILSGTKSFKEQVELGWTEEQIKATWQPKLNAYKAMRKKYLLYSDFE
ncbi:exo-beta-N-acetylmuramidase NamZ family protein [Roseivirga sp.]|uniref:exo-beta-N-acetylmuramidase NamZ family protein n=1 Tax=Roseivirga sp. TaxID=1964215 RepID=UPI003B8C8DA0